MLTGQNELSVGMALPDSAKLIKQDNINLYAEASRDFNPIHLDPEFAKKTELGGIVAHGMLVLGYLSSYLTDIFGKNWLTGSLLNIRFKTAARPGDTLITGGRVIKIEKNDGYTSLVCSIICRNQNAEAVISGEARVGMRDLT